MNKDPNITLTFPTLLFPTTNTSPVKKWFTVELVVLFLFYFTVCSNHVGHYRGAVIQLSQTVTVLICSVFTNMMNFPVRDYDLPIYVLGDY